MKETQDIGVLQRTYPYLGLWTFAVILSDVVSPGFAAVVGATVFALNASLRASIGGEPLYVP